MAQQPNIQVPARAADTASPRPSDRWDPGSRPGVITSPADVPSGGPFGSPGPDPGWVYGIVKLFEIPDDTPGLVDVVTALAAARAAGLGRAAVPEDVRVALMFCGFGENLPNGFVERRQRWVAAAPHQRYKGQSAVAEVDRSLLVMSAERIRYAINRTG